VLGGNCVSFGFFPAVSISAQFHFGLLVLVLEMLVFVFGFVYCFFLDFLVKYNLDCSGGVQ